MHNTTRGTRRFIIGALAATAALTWLPSATALANPARPATGTTRPTATPASWTDGAAAAVRAIARTGTIAGTVQGPADIPLGGVCVTATGPDGDRFARSTPAGRYVLTGLRPGLYSVSYSDCTSRAGYLGTSYPGRVVVTGGLPAELAPISLAAVSPAHAIAAEQAYLAAHPALAAAASKPAITGTVRSAAGKPLAGICVTATATMTMSNGSSEGFFYGQTGPRGDYSVPAEFGGKNARWHVLFTDGCGNRGDYAPQWWRDSASSRTASLLLQRTNSSTFSGIDARLTKGGAVSGVVRADTASGPGLRGVCVLANGLGDQSGVQIIATTQANGRYDLLGVGTGRYFVSFLPYCGQNGNYLDTNFGDITTRIGKTRPGVSGFLRPGATISGTVTSSQAGSPAVPGICVNLGSGNGNGNGGEESPAITTRSGGYTFDRLPPGTYYLNFAGGCGNAGSYAPQYFDAQAGAGTANGIKLRLGGTATANAVMLPGATIAGTVTSQQTGKPLANVCVLPISAQQAGFVPPDDDGLAALNAGDSFSTASTGRGGSYSDADLAPGQYIVIAGGCGGPDTTAQYANAMFTAGTGSPQWVTASAGTTTNVPVAMPLAGAISGTVTGRSGHGLGGVCVEAISTTGADLSFYAQMLGGAGPTSTTTGNGHYFAGQLAPGQYDVEFVPCDVSPYAPQLYKGKGPGQRLTVVTVRPGRTTGGINARLNAGTTVSGVVESGVSHRPVRGACVVVFPADTSLDSADVAIASGGQAGKTGRFTLTHLAPGSYDLLAGSCDSDEPTVQVPLRVPDHKTVVITLPQTGAISGSVSAPAADGGGAGICVVATPISGEGYQSFAATNGSGKYSVPGLAPGTYQVQFTQDCVTGTAALGELAVSPVTVTAGTTATANGALTEVGSITGTVSTAAAAPVAGECVAAFPSATATTPLALAITSADGSYQIGFLTAGSYLVRFSSGCGGPAYATQWWDGAASAGSAAQVSVAAGTATPLTNVVLTP